MNTGGYLVLLFLLLDSLLELNWYKASTRTKVISKQKRKASQENMYCMTPPDRRISPFVKWPGLLHKGIFQMNAFTDF